MEPEAPEGYDEWLGKLDVQAAEMLAHHSNLLASKAKKQKTQQAPSRMSEEEAKGLAAGLSSISASLGQRAK